MLKHKALFLGLMAVLVAGFALGGQAIPNWPAPSSWTPSRSAGVHTLGDATQMLPFIGLAPCRVADTRGNGFGGAYGPPSIGANTTRSFTIAGQCGIPASAQAVSFNFLAANVFGAGDLRVFPAGGAVPNVSTLNYNANTQNIANAAVVPLGTGGAITVQADAVTIDLVIDVNGYYGPASGGGLGGYFVVVEPYTGLFGLGGGVIFAENTAASTQNTYGGNFYADSSGAGSAGVHGVGNATTGAVFGVFGATNSGNASDAAAGVYGQVAGGLSHGHFTGQVGVLGDNGCGSGCGGDWGVMGLSLQRGVQGTRTDGSGNFQTAGVLGFGGSIGVYSYDDYGGIGVKYFIEPHPTDATKQINYISLEGPEAGTYFRGRGRFVDGQAVIPVPEDFRLVTEEDGLTVQITPIGRMAQVGVVSMDLNNIVAAGSRDVEFSYLVQGVRKGYADVQPIRENTVFVPSGPNDMMGPYPERIRQRLVSLGIYNQDGTVNMDTARRLGWDRVWEARAKPAPVSKAPNQNQ